MSISLNEQNKLLSALFEAMELPGHYAEILCENGFKSFNAWKEFEAACCENSKELDELSKYSYEKARLRFITPNGLLARNTKQALDALIPWRTRLADRHSPFYSELDILEQKRNRVYAKYRAIEAERFLVEHRCVDSKSNTFAKVFGEILLSEFQPLGYSIDEAKSKRSFPVISKKLNAIWSICWSAENTISLLEWPMARSDFPERWTSLSLSCFVASNKHIGEVRPPILPFDHLEFMLVRIQALVDGFGWAYSRINGLPELKLCVAAHRNLYSLVMERIESILASLLPKI